MAERRMITDREKAVEGLRVLQGKIDRIQRKRSEMMKQARELNAEEAPLQARLEYLLQDPVLEDVDKTPYLPKQAEAERG